MKNDISYCNFYNIITYKCNFCDEKIKNINLSWQEVDNKTSIEVNKFIEKSRLEIVFIDKVGNTYDVSRQTGSLMSASDCLDNSILDNKLGLKFCLKQCNCHNSLKEYFFVKTSEDNKFIQSKLTIQLSDKYLGVYNIIDRNVTIVNNLTKENHYVGNGISMNKFHYMFDTKEKIQKYVSLHEANNEN